MKTVIITCLITIILFGERVASADLNAFVLADPNFYSLCIEDKVHEVQHGEVVELETKIENDGRETIEILRIVNNSCKCTAGIKINPNVLTPGQIGTLNLVYKSAGKSVGISADTFTVLSKNRKVIPVNGKVKVMINRDILISPQNIELGTIMSGEKIKKNIDITCRQSVDKKNIVVQPSSPIIKTKLVENQKAKFKYTDESKPSAKYFLNITAVPTDAKGNINEYIDILIKNYQGRDRKFRIVISGRLSPILKIEPEHLFLGYIKPPKTIKKGILLTNAKKETLEIISVDFPKDITGSYNKTDLSSWQKRIEVELRLTNIKKNIGKLPITIKVRYDNKICQIIIPCIYIGNVTK